MVDIVEGQKCVYRIGSDMWAYSVVKIINSRKIIVKDNRCHNLNVFTLRQNGSWSKIGERYTNLGYLDFSQTETKLDPEF